MKCTWCWASAFVENKCSYCWTEISKENKRKEIKSNGGNYKELINTTLIWDMNTTDYAENCTIIGDMNKIKSSKNITVKWDMNTY